MRHRAAAGTSSVTVRPWISTLPRSGRSRPAIRRSVVVLPAPVGPSSTTNSPFAIESERLRTASTAPKLLLTSDKRNFSHAVLPHKAPRAARCPLTASNRESRSGRRASPTVSPILTGLPDGSRALIWPLPVVTVTICVVPRYSAPITRPRRPEASANETFSGRTPSANFPSADPRGFRAFPPGRRRPRCCDRRAAATRGGRGSSSTARR